MPANFLDAFLTRAALAPDAAAFVLPGQADDVVTNQELCLGAARWATLLRTHGARADQVVPLSLPVGRAVLEAFLGTLLAGCVPTMMPVPSAKQDPDLFWSSHDRLFARLGCSLIVTTRSNAEAVATHVAGVAMVALTPDMAEAVHAEGKAPTRRSGADVACLQHSSGTTGLKKGVALSFDAIDAQLSALVATLAITPVDTIVSWLPLYHDMGFVACLLLPLATGVAAVLIDPFAWLLDPLALLEAAAHHRASLAWMPNFAFAHLVNAADDERQIDLSSLRALIDCSEPCRAETLDAFSARFAAWGFRHEAAQTCYAMAETVFAVTQSRGEPARLRVDRGALESGRVVPSARDGVLLVSSGVPLPGVALSFLDDGGVPIDPERVGQIAVAAPFLFAGYHLDPERTAAVLCDNLYRTGDLGFLWEGELFVLGRGDDLIILLGRNVYAHEIEALLAGVVGLKAGRVLAMGIPDAATGSSDLILIAETTTTLEERQARSEIRRRLESVLGITPKRCLFVPAGWLVKSTSGKIGRAENRRKFLALEGEAVRRSA